MAMFDAVRKGFRNAIHSLEGKQEITEENIDEALKAIRVALFEADVNFQVVRRFLKRVKEASVGEVVQTRAAAGKDKLKVSPGEVFIKICHDELEKLMGPVDTSLTFVQERLGPTVIMLVGLQGAGKTTTTGKLARWIQHHKDLRPMLVACDVYRPAAVDQLRVLGERLGVPVYAEDQGNPPDIAEAGVAKAREQGCGVVLIDTAGRLAVDDLLMAELEEIVGRVKPQNILLVVDAMIGQDAVNTAREFNERLELDGFIMTKLDGDARGGAALSIKEITGKPIKFVGVGEGLDSLQEFQPAGFADRILGMGDIRSLVGRLENVITEQEAVSKEKDAERMLRGEFDLHDFLEQIRMIKRMGSLTDVLEMMPFGAQLPDGVNVDDNELIRIESMIQSMTPHERRNPSCIAQQVTRARRIARGSGRTEKDIQDLLQRFSMMKAMLSQFGQNQGGFLSKIPGFKQLAQFQQMKKSNLSDFFSQMNPQAGGGPAGFGDLANMMGGMPGAPQQPALPKGFSQPGRRMESTDARSTKSQIDREKERRKKQKARLARKKGRR